MTKPRYFVAAIIILVLALVAAVAIPAYQRLVQQQATPTATASNSSGYNEFATASPTPTATPTPAYDTTVPTTSLPGWKLEYTNDFTKPAATGAFEQVYGTTFMGYNGFFDHANNGTGLYAPLRVLSVQNGLLDYNLHTENGTPLVAAVTPTGYTGQKYGMYSVRFKADLAPGYRIAFLLWPDGAETHAKWEKGEVDFPEVNLIDTPDPKTGLTPSINGYSHDTTGNPTFNPLRYITNQTAQQWHTATIAWTPTSITFTLDGVSKSTTDPAAIPQVPMHWVLQTQTTSTKGVKPDAAVHGNVYVDWIAQYAYDPASK